ncbi:RadC family protein [Aquirhabdus parva]|uniref:JAB domain-containing protein n=1 Tax=Aquirhabdus parva TaxID=2283318 RepID=A0A345P3X6_9GAMM|nr:DNA repair protein RadC [Aquirhabdus parva]AXI01985.1 JAB domain-containing protein [Aquirhabdus parva]
MSIRNWPESERPRERLLGQGAAALSDAELLAIFLRTGTAQQSAIELARGLIDQFEGLAGLFSATPSEVMACHGIGPAKYTHLLAALELGRRHSESELRQGVGLNDPRVAIRYISQQLKAERREVFAVLFLDSQLRLLAFEKIFFGSMTSCSVHIREVMSRALAHRAVQIIIAHNHPDAPAQPSEADIALTQQLMRACQLFDIQLVDHVIVGTSGSQSLALKGLMPVPH